MFIEDKANHQGPINIEVTSSMTVGELKIKVCYYSTNLELYTATNTFLLILHLIFYVFFCKII